MNEKSPNSGVREGGFRNQLMNSCSYTTFPRRSLPAIAEEALIPMWNSAKKQEPGRSPGFSDL